MPAPVLQFKRGNAGVAGTVPALRPGEPAISLNNFDFFIGIDTSVANNKFFGSHRYWGREDGTNSLRLKLVDKDGSNYVAIKTPDTLAGIVTYTLPGVQGGSQTVLTNDGSGNLSWSSGSLNAIFSGITTIGGDLLDVNVNSDFSGIATFSNTTDNVLGDPDTGAVQINGGLGVNKNVTVGAGLSVNGTSHFVGTCTFGGGTINLGDSNTDDIIVTGEFKSSLVPTDDGLYDLGIPGKRWRDINTNGVATIGSLVCQDGGLFTGSVQINTNLNVNGNITVGGTTVTLKSQDVFIENKDIVLGYTTSITPNDDTANHAGVAIASTIGTPVVAFNASGINTLPDTYKQMMWFKSGTLGFSTDAFAFNYGVAIGTTTMGDGVRLAVGSGITMSDNTITAVNANFTNLNASFPGGSITGTISTATRATTVDTTSTSVNTNYHLVFTDSASSSIGATMRVDAGIYYNPSSNNLFASQFIGDLSAGTIKAADATTSMTIANSTGNVTFNGDIQVGGNDILASDGNTNITMTSNTLTEVKGDLQVTGNDIKSSTGANAISLSGSDVTVNGNLYVNGSTTQVNTTAITVEDRTIEMGVVDGSAPSSATTWDLGVLFNYYTDAAKKSAVIWEHGDTRFKFASVLASDTNGTNANTPQLTVTTFAPIEIGALWVNDCAGQSQVISCTGTERFLENITVDAGTF